MAGYVVRSKLITTPMGERKLFRCFCYSDVRYPDAHCTLIQITCAIFTKLVILAQQTYPQKIYT